MKVTHAFNIKVWLTMFFILKPTLTTKTFSKIRAYAFLCVCLWIGTVLAYSLKYLGLSEAASIVFFIFLYSYLLSLEARDELLLIEHKAKGTV